MERFFHKFWRAFAIGMIVLSVVTLAYIGDRSVASFFGSMNWATPRPTPAPIVRHCINRQRVIDEIADRFSQEVHLLNPNDFSIIERYTRRPSGAQFTDEEKINMLIHSIIFQAQKPGTGKYLKGRYDVYFENDVACKIQFTDLNW